MIYPIKAYIINKREVDPHPDDIEDEEVKEYHQMCLSIGSPAIERYEVEGYVLGTVRSVYNSTDAVSVDAFLCTDMYGSVRLKSPDAVRVDMFCIEELHRQLFR